MEVLAVEIIEDRTMESRCDEGFLTLRRLVVRNRYTDGTTSAPYPCDVLRRPGSDAVVAVLYRIRDGRVEVLLREALRVPIYLRRGETFVHPDPREYTSVLEVVAGMVERSDPPGRVGLQRRAAVEALEEAGCVIAEGAFEVLGGETFASPGTGDEKLYFCAAEADFGPCAGGDRAGDGEGRVSGAGQNDGSVSGAGHGDGSVSGAGHGDGSAMEEWGRLHVLSLSAAIAACRSGAIPDMKTEVALLRLADHLGWVMALGRFLHELPADLRGGGAPRR